ncbi:toprim domain-containing protein, partial [Francisellaceae bacterium CB52]
GGKGEKYGLNQEVLDANTKFAIVAELADVTRDVGREYYKLLGESDSKELSDDSQAILQKKYAYRNELAYRVATNFEELAVAIEHNNLDLSQISKWSDNHIAETNFEKFINSSDVLYKGSIAESIGNTQRGKMLLSKHNKWQEYSQCFGEFKLDGLISNNIVTQEDITLVEKYLGYRDEAYSYYKKTQEEYFDIGDKELEQMLTGYRNEANALNKKGDVVAYQIVNNLEHYKQIIEAKYTGKMFDNVINSIERQARYHKCREDVEKYKHAKGLTREQFAYRISVNGKEYARFVAEAQVDWKDINKDSRRLRLEAFRDDLDSGIKPIFDAMQEYKETGSKIFEIMSLSSFETRTQEDKQDISTLVTKRNQQANDLLFTHGLIKYKKDDNFLKKLHPSGIDVDKLFKQYESHKENLIAKQTVERYSQALNYKADTLSANILAHQITGKYGVHAKHFKQHNIDTRDLNKKSWHHQLYLDNGQFNGVDKQLHRDISDYLIAKNEASIAWMQAKQEKGANKDLLLLKAKHLSQNRNELAYKVSQGLGQTSNSKAYELFEFSSFFDKGKRSNIDLQALVKSAKEHELIVKLKEYGEFKPLTNESKSLAYDISRQYSKGAIFYTLQQLELNSKDFYVDRKAFEREMDADKEFAHAKVDFELYKKSSGIANYQGKIADRILSNQSNLRLLDRADINYNNINIHALEYRLENYISSKDARVIEKLDFERINTVFKANLDNYSHIFGSKTKETANIIYFGKFSVSKKSCKWWDDNQSAYRDPTEAMMKVHGTRHKQTGENYAEFVGRVAGLEKYQLRFKEVVDPVKNQLQNDLADFKEKVHKQQAVQMLWNKSQPLEGTIADRYLKEHRGITDTLSLAMRYLPKGTDIMLSSGKIKPAHAPMLLVGGYNAKGEIVSAQRIYLDEQTANKNTQMDNPKLSMGLVSGSGGLVQKGTSDRVYIVEGPETGASIAIADKEASVYCSFGLGNLSKLDSLIKANNYKEVILAADNDGAGSNAERLTKEAQQQLEKKG